MRRRLAKPKSRIDGDPCAGNTGGLGTGDPIFQKLVDLDRREPIMRVLLHRFGRTLHMHDGDGGTAGGGGIKRALTAQTVHIIDDAGTGGSGA